MALIDVSSNPMVLGDTLALKKPFLKAPHPMKIGDLKQVLVLVLVSVLVSVSISVSV